MIALPQTLDFPRENNIREICNSLLTLLQKKDTGLYMHSQQVANYSACIAAKLGLPAAEIASIKSAALLHDIGHLSVPNTILKKSPYLSTREMATYKRHCQAGASMLENIPEFAHIIDIIYQHARKYSGICAYYRHYLQPPRKVGRHRLPQAFKRRKHTAGSAYNRRSQLLRPYCKPMHPLLAKNAYGSH